MPENNCGVFELKKKKNFQQYQLSIKMLDFL